MKKQRFVGIFALVAAMTLCTAFINKVMSPPVVVEAFSPTADKGQAGLRNCYTPGTYDIEAEVECCTPVAGTSCTNEDCPSGTTASDYCKADQPY